MSSADKPLGILKPLGGGDPIPLLKEELVIGRRPTSDIRLDFENVSGKHCVLRLIKGVWNVRDLGSTNGTTLNSARLQHEESVMPDDEIGIAGHFYNIDYEPAGPAALLGNKQALVEEEDIVEQRRQHSLMELAGLAHEMDRPPSERPRPRRAPEKIARHSAEDAEFDDAIPAHFKAGSQPKVEIKDDDFFKFVEEDVEKLNNNKNK